MSDSPVSALDVLSRRPLRRHPLLPPGMTGAHLFLGDRKHVRIVFGIIRHDDAVEACFVRDCDGTYLANHAAVWREQHGRWRWTPGEGVGFMDGTVPDAEMVDRIERAVLRELQRYELLWEESDGGRGSSRRPRQRNDCVVRAAALAIPKPYDEVYEILADRGRRCSGSTSKDITRGWFEELGAPRTVYQAVRGRPRLHVREAVRMLHSGRHILQVAGHVLAVRDGVALDTHEPRWDACVYASWKFSSL